MKKSAMLIISVAATAAFADMSSFFGSLTAVGGNEADDLLMSTKEVDSSKVVATTLPSELANAKTVFVPSTVESGSQITEAAIRFGKLYINGNVVTTPLGNRVMGFLPNQNGYLVLVNYDPNSMENRQINAGTYIMPQGVQTLHPLVAGDLKYPFNAAFYQVSKAGQAEKMLATTSFKEVYVTKDGIYVSYLLDPSNKESKKSLIGMTAEGTIINGPQNFNEVLPSQDGFIGVLSDIQNVKNGCYNIQRTDYYYKMTHNGNSWERGNLITQLDTHLKRTSFQQITNSNIIDVDMPNYNQSIVTGLVTYIEPNTTTCGRNGFGYNGTYTGIVDIAHLDEAHKEMEKGKSKRAIAMNGQYAFNLYNNREQWDGITHVGAVKASDKAHFFYLHKGGSMMSKVFASSGGLNLGLEIYDQTIGGDKRIDLFAPSNGSDYEYGYTAAAFIQTPNNAYMIPTTSKEGNKANGYLIDNNGSWFTNSALKSFLMPYSISTPKATRL